MPIRVSMVDEHSRPLEKEGEAQPVSLMDSNGVLELLAGRAESAGRQLRVLQYIDPYGMTWLNCLQQEAALADIDGLIDMGTTQDETIFLNALRRMISECNRLPHQYIRFSGD